MKRIGFGNRPKHLKVKKPFTHSEDLKADQQERSIKNPSWRYWTGNIRRNAIGPTKMGLGIHCKGAESIQFNDSIRRNKRFMSFLKN